MANPRITVIAKKDENDDPAGVYLYLNPEGRDLLVNELNRLSEKSDHFHMGTKKWAMDLPLEMKAYEPEIETPVSNVKVMFRPDDWDQKYYPHVMTESAET